jgi:hypothetical protein
MPWEILRTTRATPDGRPIDIITKGGSLTGYFSTIALLPEFGLGVTFLTAGSQAAIYDLRERVIAALISETDKLLREEVQRSYCGTYAYWDDWFGPPNMEWAFSVAVDESGPGLKVLKWTSNGTDFLAEYGRLKHMPSDPELWEARLLPTGVYGEKREDGNPEDGGWDVWRLNAVPKRVEGREGRIFEDYCMTDADALMYGGISVEEFVFGKNGELSLGGGQAYVASLSGMRTGLLKFFDCEGREIGSGDMKPNAAGEESGFGFRGEKQKPLVFV